MIVEIRPEKSPAVAAAPCPGMGRCGGCPFADRCRSGSVAVIDTSSLIGKPVSGYKEEPALGKVVDLQAYISSRDIPAREVKKVGCKNCTDGSCQKCRRAA